MAAKLTNDQKVIRIFSEFDWLEGKRLLSIAQEIMRQKEGKAPVTAKPRKVRKAREAKRDVPEQAKAE